MKKITAYFICGIIAAAMLTGCGSPKNSAEGGTTAADMVEGNASDSVDTATSATQNENKDDDKDDDDNGTVKGVVIDASMNQVTVQTDDGDIETYSIEDDSDTSALVNGILLGNGISIKYEDDKLVSAEDLKTASGNSEALEVAGEVIMSVDNENLESLADLCAYPVYIGLGKGEEIKSSEDLLKKYKADDIFTDELEDAVTATDLLKVEESKAGIVLSGNGEKPDIIISDTDSGWMITGINY